MIPEDIIIKKNEQQPSLTYRIDFKKNKIVGVTDGLEAVKQAVFLMLSSERDYSTIYEDYGIRVNELIGKDKAFVLSELKKRIVECLKNDERIIEVDNFEFNDSDDCIEIKFNVLSAHGGFVSKGVFNI